MTRANVAWRLRNALRRNYIWGLLSTLFVRGVSACTGWLTMTAQLSAQLVKADGVIVDYGVLGRRVVTNAFVNDLVDELQAYSGIDNYKYHDSGTGTTAESASDTAIEIDDGESRAAGTQTEGASANIYRSVGTINYSASKAITEHGLFDAATAGTLMDRTVFSAINVANGDSIQFTYELTINSGS